MAVSATGGETPANPVLMGRAPRPRPNRGRPPGPFTVDPHRSLIYRLARSLVLALLRLWFRPKVRGRSQVPVVGPAIIAPVHRSNLDFAFAGLLTERKLFFMAKEELWRWRWFGRLLESLGAFPVHRGGADRESVRRAQEVLERGQLLVVFPEGARRSGHRVEELQDGVAFLAARTGAPVVPVGIAGSERAMPKGSKFPKPLPITVAVGEPLAPERADGRRVARSQLRQLSEDLRKGLQAAYDEAAGR
jgi:1-acyl-sn-glycerol-3-phosphate acyltransferase